MNRPFGKLGKLAPRHDPRTLRLAHYFTDALPAAPPSKDWAAEGKVVAWPMMLNDSLGDCTCAAAGHMIEAWTANGNPALAAFVPADADILDAYKAVSGYDPADPTTDTGAVELDVLRYWRRVGIAGHEIGAFASIRPANTAHVKAAVHLFGGVYIGLALPLAAQTQDVWDFACPGPDAVGGSWGGHAVNIVAYDADGLTCITWGDTKRMTWAFWRAYCDEAYALISTDFLRGDGKTPDGFDLAALNADLAAL